MRWPTEHHTRNRCPFKEHRRPVRLRLFDSRCIIGNRLLIREPRTILLFGILPMLRYCSLLSETVYNDRLAPGPTEQSARDRRVGPTFLETAIWVSNTLPIVLISIIGTYNVSWSKHFVILIMSGTFTSIL